MPELPEVEATRRGLLPVLLGRKIVSAEVRRPRMLRRQPDPADYLTRLEGREVRSLGRLGKFLMFELDGGNTWVFHLGMSGRMYTARRGGPEGSHVRVAAETDDGAEVRMVDPRTFGFTAVFTPEELASAVLSRLGPDALTALPPAEEMSRRAARRWAAVKTLLLDQRFLAGLGNIYSDEVLFEAGVAGRRPACSLTSAEMEAVRGAVGPVLAAGLEHGGTSLGDLAYLLPDGRAGRHLAYLSVYGREGLPCRRCGAPILREVIGGRSSCRCPRCQPLNFE